MKKGQQEILGLLVIVILAVIIIGIVIAFIVSGGGGTDDKIRRNLETSKLADTILQYTPPASQCPGESQKDLRRIIKECDFSAPGIVCGENCDVLIQNEANNIIGEIEKFQAGRAYGLQIEKQTGTLTVSTCQSDTRFADNSIDPTFTMRLFLCVGVSQAP